MSARNTGMARLAELRVGNESREDAPRIPGWQNALKMLAKKQQVAVLHGLVGILELVQGRENLWI